MIGRVLFAVVMVVGTIAFSWGRPGSGAALAIVVIWALLFVGRERPQQASIRYFGKPAVVACDGRCSKAWGRNGRARVVLSDDGDDFAFLSDRELGVAPADPGTYEGGDGKPETSAAFPNRWCVRECERSVLAAEGARVVLPDFRRRVYNQSRGEG